MSSKEKRSYQSHDNVGPYFSSLGRPLLDSGWLNEFSENFRKRTKDHGLIFNPRQTPGLVYASGRDIKNAKDAGLAILSGISMTKEYVDRLISQGIIDEKIAITGLRVAVKLITARPVYRTSASLPGFRYYGIRAQLADVPNPTNPSQGIMLSERQAVHGNIGLQRSARSSRLDSEVEIIIATTDYPSGFEPLEQSVLDELKSSIPSSLYLGAVGKLTLG